MRRPSGRLQFSGTSSVPQAMSPSRGRGSSSPWRRNSQSFALAVTVERSGIERSAWAVAIPGTGHHPPRTRTSKSKLRRSIPVLSFSRPSVGTVGGRIERRWVGQEAHLGLEGAARKRAGLGARRRRRSSRRACGICDQTATAATSGVAGSWVALATSTLGWEPTCKRCGGFVASRGQPTHDPGNSCGYSQAKCGAWRARARCRRPAPRSRPAARSRRTARPGTGRRPPLSSPGSGGTGDASGSGGSERLATRQPWPAGSAMIRPAQIRMLPAERRARTTGSISGCSAATRVEDRGDVLAMQGAGRILRHTTPRSGRSASSVESAQRTP